MKVQLSSYKFTSFSVACGLCFVPFISVKILSNLKERNGTKAKLELVLTISVRGKIPTKFYIWNKVFEGVQ